MRFRARRPAKPRGDRMWRDPAAETRLWLTICAVALLALVLISLLL